ARTNLDADDLLSRDPGQGHIQRLRLRARASAVDYDVAGSPGKAAHVNAALLGLGRAKVQREAGYALHDVVCAARRILGEEGRVVDGLSSVLRSGCCGWCGRLTNCACRRGE